MELRELLTDLQLGDQKPSQLLRGMKLKAGDKVADALPAGTQATLRISEATDLSRLSEMADRLLEVREPLQVSTVATYSVSPVPMNDGVHNELVKIRSRLE